jgi:hypothetical protein
MYNRPFVTSSTLSVAGVMLEAFNAAYKYASDVLGINGDATVLDMHKALIDAVENPHPRNTNEEVMATLGLSYENQQEQEADYYSLDDTRPKGRHYPVFSYSMETGHVTNEADPVWRNEPIENVGYTPTKVLFTGEDAYERARAFYYMMWGFNTGCSGEPGYARETLDYTGKMVSMFIAAESGVYA